MLKLWLISDKITSYLPPPPSVHDTLIPWKSKQFMNEDYIYFSTLPSLLLYLQTHTSRFSISPEALHT